MRSRGREATARRDRAFRFTKAQWSAMIEEAIIDCYGDAEQISGWSSAIEDHLVLPFETMVLGVPVSVVQIDLDLVGQIVALCARGRERQAIAILDLPLPSPPPAGAEWIEAYRRWVRGL